ncbi:transposable element gene, partial [Prunus dulcis]
MCLSAKFSMKNLGPLHYFWVFRFSALPDTMFLSQQKYICDLFIRFSMLDCKPCSTPSSSQKLDNTSGEPLSDPTAYRSLVGALQYLTWTRPEIAFSVNQVCQHMHAPRTPHLSAVKRILRYLKGTPAHGLLLRKGNLNLTAYSDADWAGCPIDRRSTTGYCIFFGQNLVSWSSKKQASVARSSTESEYRSLAHTASEIFWICSLLKEIHFYLDKHPLILCDNTSAIALASNPIFHARTKHIEIDYHYICDL